MYFTHIKYTNVDQCLPAVILTSVTGFSGEGSSISAVRSSSSSRSESSVRDFLALPAAGVALAAPLPRPPPPPAFGVPTEGVEAGEGLGDRLRFGPEQNGQKKI